MTKIRICLSLNHMTTFFHGTTIKNTKNTHFIIGYKKYYLSIFHRCNFILSCFTWYLLFCKSNVLLYRLINVKNYSQSCAFLNVFENLSAIISTIHVSQLITTWAIIYDTMLIIIRSVMWLFAFFDWAVWLL
jgi:hypothetical protein